MKREAEEDLQALEGSVKQEVAGEQNNIPKQSSEPKEEEEQKQATQVVVEEKKEFKKLPPKLRIAMIAGYNGRDFCGSQKNKNVRTVEGELEEALYRLNVISDFNYGDLKKIGFNRATRTDKRVHALQNVFSCKAHLYKRFDPEEFRDRLNKELPQDISIFNVLEVSNNFNAKLRTSNREYSYYLPTFLLKDINQRFLGNPLLVKEQAPVSAPKVDNGNGGENEEEKKEEEKKETGGIKIFRREEKDLEGSDQEGEIEKEEEKFGQVEIMSRNIEHITEDIIEDLYQFRLSKEQHEKVNRLFQYFLGTRKYHNYTRNVKPTQNAACRFMLELDSSEFLYVNRETLEITGKDDPKALEFLHFFFKGQSFLYNQIRKMIGVIIQINRGQMDEQFQENTMRDNTVNVALAPGDGLLLEKVCYDKYNEVNKKKKNEIMLTLVKQSEEVQAFREDIVKQIVKSEVENKAFVKWLSYFDDFCDEFYVTRKNQEQEK